MIRILIVAALTLHGVIHLIGFVVPWRLATLEGFAYTTTSAWGRLELGESGVKVLGVGWLLAAILFILAAVAVWREASWAIPFTAAVALGSLVLTVLGAPAAVMGIVVNVVILVAVGYLILVAVPARQLP